MFYFCFFFLKSLNELTSCSKSPCFTVLTKIMKLYEGWIFARFTLSIYTAANISGTMNVTHTALLWQKEASDKSDISCNRAKCICHSTDVNGISWYFTSHIS